jgi:serine/threonine protein kinase
MMMMTGARPDEGPEVRGYRYRHGDRPLDGYTIQRAAGRGGFGEVYYALSDGGREVALKVVHAYEQVELRGIGQCMNLKSPHLVSVFDVRTGTDGQPVVVMEFVAGPSLRELLDESPAGFGTQKAAFFLREIGKGLTYLHDCGIVHRDLKPANIFYENGYVKIGDYGLSKAISASHRSDQTVTVGTLHYMAPEVGAGRYDRGIDIYALGALLYEMLTGQPPFFGISPAEVLMKHLSAQVNVDGIEEPFATVIRKALAKDPAERYQSVQEMVEAVFGAEHVRQSVSCFAPATLTMVAGRVARQAPGLGRGGLPALSSRTFGVAGDGGCPGAP